MDFTTILAYCLGVLSTALFFELRQLLLAKRKEQAGA